MAIERSTPAPRGASAHDILQLLRDGTPKSRTELATLTGLARSTVTDRLETLMAIGLVGPVADGTSTGGRPPSRVALHAQSKLLLAVDLGAAHLRLALTDLLHQTLAATEATVDLSQGPEPVLQDIHRLTQSLLQQIGRDTADILCVGMGVPGPVHFDTGRPSRPPLMPGWDNFDIRASFAQQLDAPVMVDNDVNLMALGEHHGHGGNLGHFLYVKVATGIGAGIISGGQLQRGAQGTAGDIGHVRVSRGSGVQCHCGNEGCLEAVASGPRIADALRAVGLPDVHSARDVIDLVNGGNLEAIKAVRRAGGDIGEVLAAGISFLNPSLITIGGQMAAAGEHLLAGIREVIYNRAMPLATAQLQIRPATTTHQAGLLGASILAADHGLGSESITALALSMR
ncbi:ROK family transcriptional regulator [Glutamicibacter sp. PS]|uniref:ROK family transcriptional regulator n=1 Tax=Glutamicibacter sp. PS TaxID=3075634 RepID=UPI0028420902|nr:ROK family transcriptional regulator [Glutamicibacter sp. PS]MDR4533431.1 ROK family protein [Glutamicibacter sp. PS]